MHTRKQPPPIPSAQPSPEALRLVKKLGSLSPRKRFEAEREIRRTAPDIVEDVLQIARRADLGWRRRCIIAIGLALLFIGVPALLTALHAMGVPIPPAWRTGTQWLLSRGAVMTVCLANCLLTLRWPHPVCTTRALMHLDDPRIIGSLADAYRFLPYNLHNQIRVALGRLAPRIDAEIASGLTESQWSGLYRLLADGPPDVRLSMLRILMEYGVPSAIRHVERVIAMDVSLRVRQAARETLSVLKARAEAQQEQSRLLRPAQSGTPATELLRPVSNSISSSDSQLLRPSLNATEDVAKSQ